MEKVAAGDKFESEEDRQLARVLATLIWASWGVFLFVIFTAVVDADRRLIVVTLLGCAGLILPMVLLRRRHLRASSLILMLFMLGTVTFIATIGQGIRDLSLVAFPILFIFAGLALEQKYFRLCIGLALLAATWLALGEIYGWFTPVPFSFSQTSNWFYLIAVVLILLVGALAVDRLAAYMRRSLERARAEVALRKHMEQEVLKLNASLEERVAERTHELQEAQEKILRQEKLAILGQMAGSVGHELRNPLGVINSSIYYLRLVLPDANEKIKQHLDMIENQVHVSDKIIGDLLGFARVTSVKRETVVVSDLVKRVLERFPVPATITLALEIPDSLPRVVVDPLQMEQVLGNLVTNGCQAMPEGGKLTVSANHQEEMVAIAVRDSGSGITPENMQKLFEPLFTTKAGGIGLGLAVSKKLAEANGGRIEVESEAGKGSTFRLVLPVSSSALGS